MTGLIAVVVMSVASAQEAPEETRPWAVVHLDREGNVEAIESCDDTECVWLDLTGMRIVADPEIRGWRSMDGKGFGWTGNCYEDEELQQSVCEWIEWYGPAAGGGGGGGCGHGTCA